MTLLVTAVAGAPLLLAGCGHDAPRTDAPSPVADSGAARASAKVARRPPLVVMLVMDEFPTDDLRGPDGRIDAARFPNFAELAGTSTWFPNHTTVFDETSWAVPAILDGRLPRQGTEGLLGDHPRNVFTAFGSRGWGVVGREVATALCPTRLCGRPIVEPAALPKLLNRRRERLGSWIRSIKRRSRPYLYVKHEFLPHKPWVYLPSGHNDQPTYKEPLPGINSTRSFDSGYLTMHNERRQLLQVGFMDRELGVLLRHLRRAGLMDRTLLVLTADHGYAWELGVKDRRKVTEANVDEIAPTPLFIKAPRQHRGRIDRAYARTIDIVPTIADLLNLKLGYRTDGRSAFSRAVRARRAISLEARDFGSTVRIGAEELEARRAKNMARRAALFGTGDESRRLFGSPWEAVYRAGPVPELLGRRTSSFRLAQPGPLGAQVAEARLTRLVRKSSTLVQTHIAGRISGGRPDDTRLLAISVDGVVRAVGRSFYLRGEDRESFTTLVPERAMRPGSHNVRVWEVQERDGSQVLVPLGDNR